MKERVADLQEQLSHGAIAADELSENIRWIEHTYQGIEMDQRLLASAIDMETGMRGFLLAEEDVFFEPLTAD